MSEPSYRCPFCERTTYHPTDVSHSYCPCCGSSDDPALIKTCRHRRAAEKP